MTRFRTAALAAALGLAVALPAGPAAGSDHADPADPLRNKDDDDRGLTGLFAFPVSADGKRVDDPAKGDSLVLIVCVNRLLAKPPPYPGLDTFTITVSVDGRSSVRVNYPKDRTRPAPEERDTLRYGGVVDAPERIGATFEIAVRLKNDLAGFGPENITHRAVRVDRGDGLKTLDEDEARRAVTRWGAGVRDDPFVFPMFFGTNVIAVAVRVPYASLPQSSPGRTYLLWATTHQNRAQPDQLGVQTDHVGRSQRTQLPRFDLLNTLHPSKHVEAIKTAKANPPLKDDVLGYLFPPLFRYRSFDEQPDVMVVSRENPIGYPNGRRLEDDIALLACEQGDCQLYEMSFAKPASPASEKDSRYVGGRPTANDKEFLPEWPYLAEPWQDPHFNPPAGLTPLNQMKLTALVLGVVAAFLLPWGLLFWTYRRLRRVRALLPTPGLPQAPSPPPAGVIPPMGGSTP
ncbi:MAG TPA: hypothetical protein VH092_02955 [Urbifossiella sp.]|nr:hypothetical protein [Urbifossiella sp.]